MPRNEWDQSPLPTDIDEGEPLGDGMEEKYVAPPDAEDFSWGPNEVDESLRARLIRNAPNSATARHQLERLQREQPKEG